MVQIKNKREFFLLLAIAVLGFIMWFNFLVSPSVKKKEEHWNLPPDRGSVLNYSLGSCANNKVLAVRSDDPVFENKGIRRNMGKFENFDFMVIHDYHQNGTILVQFVTYYSGKIWIEDLEIGGRLGGIDKEVWDYSVDMKRDSGNWNIELHLIFYLWTGWWLKSDRAWRS